MSRLGTSRTARRYSKGAVAAVLFGALVSTSTMFQIQEGALVNEARHELQAIQSLDVEELKHKENAAKRAGDDMGKFERQVERKLQQAVDGVARVKVDSMSEDEYWIFDVPIAGQMKILRKRTSTAEVVIGGFLAGCVLELTNTVLLYPLDTMKTRLQANPDGAGGQLRFDRLFDGLGPVVAMVPLLSVFWSVKDVVRRSIIGFVTQQLSWVAWYDVIATGLAAGAGEAFYFALKTPGQLLKIKQQTEAVLEDSKPALATLLLQAPPRPFWEECLTSYPVLALSEVPQVMLRSIIFVWLHSQPNAASFIGYDILIFTIAAAISALVCTPLDVARTRLLLDGRGVQELPSMLVSIFREEGAAGFFAGWLPRLMWNGVTVGIVLGLCRMSYEDIRALFLLDVLDGLENGAQAFLDVLS
eukprot:CAMPEP_0183410534 /NCGR_PEP_ID=MMETSP0370-20130417/19643_1 /TAXON_ID=268820 /ORGANISM="Peridinium aciculiferum, Strain PAER-2" /LENGTH=415 /DNA_ID=CAMNT_0025593381 /DNA_START=72 /DNA_END=1319 /DNA_ORIENTATION=+